MNQTKLVQITTHETLERGRLSVLEEKEYPFPVKRIFWITGVAALAKRGEHAHRDGQQFIIPMGGMVNIQSFGPGLEVKSYQLVDKTQGLYVPPMHWLNIRFTMHNSALLVLASNPYAEADYIRNWDEYVKLASAV